MAALKKIGTIIISVLLWAVILIAALYAFVTLATKDENNVASLFGYTPMAVESESMSPTFNAGDLIVIKQCDPSTLQVGDIITFHTIIENQYALNTHRIVEITESDGVRSYTTKGDNNDLEDTHIIGDGDIVGKYVTRFKNVGKLMDFLSSSVGFLIVIVLPMLIFFIYQVYHLIMVSMQLKKAMAEEAQEAQAKKDAEAQAQQDDADAKLREAQAMLEEAKRLKEEAEKKSAEPKAEEEKPAETEKTAEEEKPVEETPAEPEKEPAAEIPETPAESEPGPEETPVEEPEEKTAEEEKPIEEEKTAEEAKEPPADTEKEEAPAEPEKKETEEPAKEEKVEEQ